jgi:hypothetical protein
MQYRLRGHAALQTQQQLILAQKRTKNHTTSGSSRAWIEAYGCLKAAIAWQSDTEAGESRVPNTVCEGETIKK